MGSRFSSSAPALMTRSYHTLTSSSYNADVSLGAYTSSFGLFARRVMASAVDSLVRISGDLPISRQSSCSSNFGFERSGKRGLVISTGFAWRQEFIITRRLPIASGLSSIPRLSCMNSAIRRGRAFESVNAYASFPLSTLAEKLKAASSLLPT